MDSKIVESTVEPVRSQFGLGYITSYKSNLERLETEVQNLEATKTNVQNFVDEAKRKGEVIVNVVQIWLKKVDATIAEAKKLIHNDENKYYMRYFPNLRFRHHQSKKSQKMRQEIHEVLAEGNFEKISYYKQSMLEEIQQVLKDPNIYRIGLYGIDGVGKTTLVKDLARQVEKDRSFDAVVMAEVTDSPDMENIQGQIANALGLKLDEETTEGRVGQLCQRIRKEKNILIILDDICGKLDLAELGIPFGDDHKQCKLLLMSEYRNVLKRQMGTQKDFRLEVLSDEDSWKLFEKIAGNDIKMKNIKSIAQNVATCCNGLPLLVVILAKALRKKDVSTWKDALKQLKGLDEQGFFKEVVCPLELSYHYLESDALKSLFLFIVSFAPGRIHTGELFSCYWGLYGNLHTLSEARNKYYKLINDLRAFSLLLEDEIEYVRMHAVVRDMAKAIASRTHLTYEVLKFTQMEQWDRDQLQKCHYVNLPSYNMDELPEKLDCPKLKLMSLRRNHGYLTIPDNFFSGMREVKVLNLHGMRFAPSPPPSLHLLTNLISLNLYGCVLEDIAIVAELTRLEILTLERSEIQELPKEIGQLVYLRMLNLTNCYQLKTIPTNLLSSLTSLEELYMGNCNIQWEVEGGKGQTNNASLGELRQLNQLRTLDLSIQDASVLPADMYVFANLQRYNIFIGNMWKWSSLWSGNGHETSRTLKLADSLNTKICLNRGVQLLFTTVEDLSLARLNIFVNDVFYELDEKVFPQLRHLHFQNSDAFYNLEKLILCNLHNMEDISYGLLPTHSFEKLKVIKVQDCHKLKKLLSYSLAKGLSQLHKMEISKCDIMEEIIYEEKLEDEKEFSKIMLPNLHSLILDRLSMLHSFSLPLIADKDDQSTPVSLFNQKVTIPNLQTLELCSINTYKIWDDKLPLHSCIQNLTSLKIDWCCSLTNLFTSSVAKALVKLQNLRIAYCPKLEDIFVQEEKVTFPNLETLVISDNDNLTSIWPNQLAPNSFSKLKELQISGTKILDHVFPISVVEELRQLQVLEIFRCRINNIVEKSSSHDVKHVYLEKLDVSWCYKLKTVVSSSVSFQTLNELKVDNCGVVNIITPSMTPSLPNLRIISISSCTMLEAIFGSNNESNAPSEIALMKLEELELKNLPRLTRFCCESYNINLPSLQKVRVIYCSMVVTFCHGNLTTPSPITTIQHGWSTEDKRVALFNEKVAMPNLETLELSYLNARNIWDGNLPVQFYNRNFSLAVNDCHSLQSLFSSSVARALDKLQHLKILKCHELVEIFVHEEKVTFPELETLVINEMNHLNSIWHNQQDPNSFCKLNKIQIIGCVALYYVFPIVVAKGLRQLQVLEISTSNIENIIEKSDSQVVKSVYLENLIVSKCDRLNTILQSSVLFQTLYTLEVSWCAEVIDIMTPLRTTNMPTLRILNISKCHKLEQVFGKKIIEGEAPGEITFMKLEELKLEDLSRLTSFFKESLEGLKLEDLSTLTNLFKGNLKGLKLEDLSRLTNFFKGSLEGLKLEDLDLSGVTNFFKESYNFNFPSLRRVQVIKCPNMKTFLGHRSLTKGEQPVAVALFNEKVAMPKLEILELSDINSSKIWDDKLPAHFYCQNLRILIVRGCDRFVRLFSSSTSRSLDKLQHLEIQNCRGLAEIFVQQKEDDVASPKLEELKPGSGNKGDALGEIAFMKLEVLELNTLPSLTSFCKAYYNFMFPALQIVRVIGCPNLKTFCPGNLITPSLSEVRYGWSQQDHRWDGDLNTTLERIAEG